jgi:N-glycosylase/DNA lyase
MMISFIISQQKQIPSIRKCIEALCERFGEKHSTWYGFPTPESIASAGPDGVKGLSLGYRERYIYETAVRYLTDGIPDDKLRTMPAEEVKKYLCSYTGIGDKVADCVALFGVGLVDSFPIDVHIKDILYREFVSDKTKNRIEKNIANDISHKKLLDRLSYSDYMQIVNDNFSAFDGVKGIVQQWIFAYEITK